ncbi:hypothetical protein [Amycolatopsis sp. 195334CR]|uniref:hypothetical protein n=1 Tax=Amycolatopsis sp. 195334CR TaxID=2814588 RepID=UPI001A8DDC02|nr:hypothetical protein [Amycolatopsis sp. 195334CR]MBN6034065.1 hypothetical protein [Amycolatopsis sp. 195334CR]
MAMVLATTSTATAQTDPEQDPAVVTTVADEAVVEQATDTARLAEAASGTTGPAALEVSDEGDTLVRTTSGATVTVPADPSEDIELDTPGGTSIAMSLPSATEAHDAVVVDGTTVYAQTAPQTDIAVKPTSTGVQALITIDGPSAPTTFDFGVTVPEGGQIALLTDGGATVLDATGTPAATIAAPWARDAHGAAVPTRFELDGTTLRQVVEHHDTTAYPVVADPAWFVVIGARIILQAIVSQAVKWWYERNGYRCTTYGPFWWHMLMCAKPVR